MTSAGDRSTERRQPHQGRRAADLWLRLSPRQRAILELLGTGVSNKEIASRLGVSEQAIKQQVSKLLARFGVESRAALAQSALAIRLTGQRDSDLPLEYLFDRAPIAIALTSGPGHVFRAVNRAFVELFGDREGWIGHRLRDLLEPSEAPLAPLVDAVYRAGQGVRHVGVRVRRAGSEGPTEHSLTIKVEPTRGPTGAVAGLVFFGIDVSEQIDLTVRLTTIQAERQAIVEQLPSGISVAVLDPSGRPLLLHGPIRTVIGDRLDQSRPLAAQLEPFGMRWAETGLPLDAADSPSVRALAGKEVSAHLLGRLAPDGPDYVVHVHGRPIRAADGAIAGAVLVFERLTRT